MSYGQEQAIRDIAYALKDVARAIYDGNNKRRDPIFIIVPSDLPPDNYKEISRALRDAIDDR